MLGAVRGSVQPAGLLLRLPRGSAGGGPETGFRSGSFLPQILVKFLENKKSLIG